MRQISGSFTSCQPAHRDGAGQDGPMDGGRSVDAAPPAALVIRASFRLRTGLSCRGCKTLSGGQGGAGSARTGCTASGGTPRRCGSGQMHACPAQGPDQTGAVAAVGAEGAGAAVPGCTGRRAAAQGRCRPAASRRDCALPAPELRAAAQGRRRRVAQDVRRIGGGIRQGTRRARRRP